MDTITTPEDLKQKIAVLKNQRSIEFQNLQEQFELSQASFKPINLIKSTFNDVVFSEPSLKSSIINGAVSLSTYYLANNSLLGNSSNPIKRVIGRGLKLLLKNIKQ